MNESSLIVLEDGNSVIGIENDPKTSLTMESITTKEIQIFGKREDVINTLLLNESGNLLFAGGEDEKLVKYKQNESDGQWKKVNEEDLGISSIFTSTNIENLAFFGGDSPFVCIMNTDTGEVIQDLFRTAVDPSTLCKSVAAWTRECTCP